MAKRYNLNQEDRDRLEAKLAEAESRSRKSPVRPQTPRHWHGGIPFQNTSGETVPPFGVMQCSEADLTRNRPYVEIVKPTSSGKIFLFNGPREVLDDGFGIGFREGRSLIAGSTTSDLWSPDPGEWELTPSGSHFRLIGTLDAETSYFLLPSVDFIRIKGSATTAVAGTSSFAIDGIGVMQGADPRTDTTSTTETVTVQNRLSEHCDDDAYCEAVYDQSTDEWVVNHLDSICPPE